MIQPMSDPYGDVPRPFATLVPGCVFFLIPVAPLLLAIFLLHWPWWGDVLAPVVTLVLLGIIGNRYDAIQTWAWIRRHPEVMTKKTQP